MKGFEGSAGMLDRMGILRQAKESPLNTVTNSDLTHILAGGDSFIRTKNREVKGLAITTKNNPEGPEIIVVGRGPGKVNRVRWFLESKAFVPVYVKQEVNAWKYLGDYRADGYCQDPETIEKHCRHRAAKGIDGILFLSAKDDVEVNVQPRSSPDPKQRKKIEVAAIKTVMSYYENMGYKITDRQKDNCGYDLMAEKKREFLKIEVKGTSSVEQRFFLTRNERSKSADPLWRLAVVTEALTMPKLEIFTTGKMDNTFNFDALCWECTKLLS